MTKKSKYQTIAEALADGMTAYNFNNKTGDWLWYGDNLRPHLIRNGIDLTGDLPALGIYDVAKSHQCAKRGYWAYQDDNRYYHLWAGEIELTANIKTKNIKVWDSGDWEYLDINLGEWVKVKRLGKDWTRPIKTTNDLIVGDIVAIKLPATAYHLYYCIKIYRLERQDIGGQIITTIWGKTSKSKVIRGIDFYAGTKFEV